MITALDIGFRVAGHNGPEILLNGLDLHVDAFERVGILAKSGSGKTVLARILSRVLAPDCGHVIHDGQVSLPLGFAAGLHPELTVRLNISILCQALGENPEDALVLAATLGKLEQSLDVPIKDIGAKERRALGFCMSLAAQKDVYIADDAPHFGTGEQRDQGMELLNRRLETAGFIQISHNPNLLTQTCDRFLKLQNGRLWDCDDVVSAAREM